MSPLLAIEDAVGHIGSLTLGLIVVATVLASHFVSKRDRDSKVPSPYSTYGATYLPSRVPLLGNVLTIIRNADRFIDWVVDVSLPRDGKPFTLRLPGQCDVMVTARPEHFEQITVTQYDNFIKGDHLHDLLFDLMGDGILIIDGDQWKRQRRILVNLFSPRALRENMTPIVHEHMRTLQRIFEEAAASQTPLDANKLMHRFTLEAFTEIGFGFPMDSLVTGQEHPFETAFDDAQHIIGARFSTLVWFWKLKRWLNIGSERRLKEAMQVVNALVMDVLTSSIEQRSLRTHKSDDLLIQRNPSKNIVSIILDTMEADGASADPKEVRDIAVAALIAGRDTTAGALSWLFHMLNQNPQVEDKLREELLANLPKLQTDDNYVPSMEDMQNLPYLEATIRTDVALAYHTTARLTSVWGPDAVSFVPERFLDPETGELLQSLPTKLTAFNTGPRVCVGRSLAMLEMKTVIACLVGRFQLVEVPGQDVVPGSSFTYSMKNPLMVSVRRIGSK